MFVGIVCGACSARGRAWCSGGTVLWTERFREDVTRIVLATRTAEITSPAVLHVDIKDASNLDAVKNAVQTAAMSGENPPHSAMENAMEGGKWLPWGLMNVDVEPYELVTNYEQIRVPGMYHPVVTEEETAPDEKSTNEASKQRISADNDNPCETKNDNDISYVRDCKFSIGHEQNVPCDAVHRHSVKCTCNDEGFFKISGDIKVTRTILRDDVIMFTNSDCDYEVGVEAFVEFLWTRRQREA